MIRTTIQLVERARHPGARALERFATEPDGGAHDDPAEREGARREAVAGHLARCARCRREIAWRREVRAGLRDAAPPPAPAAGLARIRARVEAGERLILPVDPEAPPRRGVRGALAALAAALVLGAALWLFAPTARLEAGDTSGTLTFEPARPRAGERVAVTYRAPATLAREPWLTLRARFRTAADLPYDWTTRQVDAARLHRDRDGVFRGELRLPDSAVFAAFAVEDSAASRVDSRDRRLWELLAHDSLGRPRLDALEQQLDDLHERDWERLLATARTMVEIYPDDPRAWFILHFAEGAVRGRAYADSAAPVHRAKLHALDAALRRRPDPPPRDVLGLWTYAQSLNDSSVMARWAPRLDVERSTDHFALVPALWRATERSRTDPAAALRDFDAIVARHGRASVSFAAPSAIALASAVGDTAAAVRWTARAAAAMPGLASSFDAGLAGQPGTRAAGMRRLRAWLASSATPDDAARPLYRTRAEERIERAADVRRALAALGDALAASGDTMAARDTLDLATRAGWDVALFDRAAATRAAVGDSAGALELLALAAADPGADTLAVRDRARRLGGRAFDADAWPALVGHARAEMVTRLAERAVRRPVRPGVRLARLDGAPVTLAEVTGGQPTVVVFWSRTCGYAVGALPALRRLAPRLAAHGVGLVLVTEERPSDELRRYVASLAGAPPVYSDPAREAGAAFRAHGTPLYFVVDARGAIRYEYTALDRVLAEAVSVAAR